MTMPYQADDFTDRVEFADTTAHMAEARSAHVTMSS